MLTGRARAPTVSPRRAGAGRPPSRAGRSGVPRRPRRPRPPASAHGCSCRQRAAVAPVAGTATRSPGPMSDGRNSSLTTMSPDSQCLPTILRQDRCRLRGAGGERAGVVGVVQRGTDVVAHPAVDGDVAAGRPSVERDVLRRADLVQRERRRTGDGASGLDRQPRDSMPRPRHSLSTISRMPAASCAGVAGSSWVVYAMPKPPPRSSSGASVAQLGRDPGVQRHHAVGRDLEPRGVEDLRADVRVQPEQVGATAAPAHGVTASNASPSVIERPNFWSSCAVAMYSWVWASTPSGHADHHPRGDTRDPRRPPASRSISTNESTMIRPTPASSARRELGRRSCCCRGGRCARRGTPPAARRRARRRCRRRVRRPSSVIHRATAVREERLARRNRRRARRRRR